MLIKEKQFNKRLDDNFEWPFEIAEDGLYLVEIIASCDNWLQNWKYFFNDDDLAVKIDDIEFGKLNGKGGLLNGEAAWNGNNLKGLKKTAIFILDLKTGEHKVNFIINKKPFIESVKVIKVDNEINYLPEKNRQAQYGNGRQWISIALVDLPLGKLKISAKAEKREQDSDDIKLIVDGQIQKNKESEKFKNWYWCGSLDKGKEKFFEEKTNFEKGLHYIELWADRKPILNKVELSLCEKDAENVETDEDALNEIAAKVMWQAAALRERPKQDEENILTELKRGEKVAVLEKAVKGERPKNNSGVPLSSNRWHKVEYKGDEGYIYSEALEIEGESKELVKNTIVETSKDENMDPEILLALANCEAQFFPYTVSYDLDNKEVAFGVMQITNDLYADLNNKNKLFYSPIGNIFDIKENIRGGVKYFKHLYEHKYGDDQDKLRKAIAAYNAGPGNVSAGEPLELELYDGQTQRLVNCVEAHLNKGFFKDFLSNKKNIFLIAAAFFISGFLLNGARGALFADKSEKDIFARDSKDNISGSPNIVWDKNDYALDFFDSGGFLLSSISTDSLKLDELFKIPDELASHDSIRIGDKIVKSGNLFYFFASTFYMCGAQNCAWVLYKYDAKNDILELIDKDIFGASVSLYPNPDFTKMAIMRYVQGGYCNTGEYISVLDLSSFEKKAVNEFNENYDMAQIEFLEWVDNETLRFSINYINCGEEGMDRVEKLYEYNAEDNFLKTILN